MQEHKLAGSNIQKLLFKLSIPATVGMLTMALYNVVDTIFVGRGVGPMAMGGLSIVFPIQIFIMAIGLMMGMGSASLISRSIGAGDLSKANLAYGNVILSNIFWGILITTLGLIFTKPILTLFGATEDIMPYASAYMRIIILNAAVFMFQTSSNNILRSEGRAKTAMGSMLIAAITNIILDPIFIFGFDMGIRGAAIATVIAQITTSIYIFFFLTSKKSTIQLRIAHLKLDWTILKEIYAIGVSAFFRSVGQSILVIIVNNGLGKYGGSIYIAAFGAVNRLISFAIMPIIGIAQGLQPIVGYNFGAKRYMNTVKSFKYAATYATIFASFACVLLLTIPHHIMHIFSSDPQLVNIGIHIIKTIAIALPVVGFQINGAMFYQATGKAVPAFLLTTSRQILFLIPLLLVLPNFFQIEGILVSFPIADILSASLTFFFITSEIKQIKRYCQTTV
ncbi:MAG: MATE family efflux transporter [Candidatus Cloacimonadota bacterium]|nr:MATE family efflux transporter [Candidatus Cloacimonadota bacterium]